MWKSGKRKPQTELQAKEIIGTTLKDNNILNMFQEQTGLNGEWPEMIEQSTWDIIESETKEEFM